MHKTVYWAKLVRFIDRCWSVYAAKPSWSLRQLVQSWNTNITSKSQSSYLSAINYTHVQWPGKSKFYKQLQKSNSWLQQANSTQHSELTIYSYRVTQALSLQTSCDLPSNATSLQLPDLKILKTCFQPLKNFMSIILAVVVVCTFVIRKKISDQTTAWGGPTEADKLYRNSLGFWKTDFEALIKHKCVRAVEIISSFPTWQTIPVLALS